MESSDIDHCEAISEDAIEGSAHGGGVFSMGSLSMQSSRISRCNASSAFPSGGQGGGLFVKSGSALLTNGAALSANTASGRGANVFVSEGSATYLLPAPPGHWIAGRVCEVARASCAVNAKGGLVDDDYGRGGRPEKSTRASKQQQKEKEEAAAKALALKQATEDKATTKKANGGTGAKKPKADSEE